MNILSRNKNKEPTDLPCLLSSDTLNIYYRGDYWEGSFSQELDGSVTIDGERVSDEDMERGWVVVEGEYY